MASQSLYRKWRSQTFSDLWGQEATVRTLLNAVREGRLAHAYLFCGPRGTGKTSAARLLAKAVNCANPRDGEPCNECDSCREIAAGRSPDVIEIDAASNTGVDNIRDLRENVNLLGSGGHHKVYILDEAHMLSAAAFNALLKTLEEPPPHVIFVLATTEAHKMLQTVVSRCQRFDFHRIGVRVIVARLRMVAEGEGLTLGPGVAELLARAAQGGLRDALSLLDQAMAYSGSEIDLERTRRMLGLADPTRLRTLIEHVAEQRAAEGLHLIHELVTSGADLRQITQQLAEEWRALMLARAGADVAELMERTDEEARDLRTLAGQFSLDELMACARIFTRDATPARGLPVPQLALELAFLECVSIRANSVMAVAPAATTTATTATATATVAPRPAIAPERHVAQPQPAAAAPMPPAQPAPAPSQPSVEELDLDAIERDEVPAVSATPATLARPARIRETPAAPFTPDEPSVPVTENAAEAPATFDTFASADEPEPMASPAAGDASVHDVHDLIALVHNNWQVIKKVTRQRSAQVSALLNSVQPVQVEAGEPPVLVLQAGATFHLEKLREPAKREAVEWALAQVLERPMRVRLALAGKDRAGPGTPIAPNRAQSAAPAAPAAPSAPRPIPPASMNGASTNGASTSSGYNGNGNGHTPVSSAPSASPRPPTAAPQAPSSPATSAASAPPSVNGKGQQSIEDEARADPVVREILRQVRVDLAEVRPLDGDGE